MSAVQLHSLLALTMGFAFAGLLTTGYQAFAQRPVSFRMLPRGARLSSFAAVPLLVFAAPFVIMRLTLRARRIEGSRFLRAMSGTVFAGFWSLMSGTVLVMALQ